uniref:Uncharacterized protein n=1 Tax=Anguilla anguilla TaxID=7936 RepID=A0A0E9R273_ANGAN
MKHLPPDIAILAASVTIAITTCTIKPS